MSEQPKKLKAEDLPLQMIAISLRFDGKTLHSKAEPLELLRGEVFQPKQQPDSPLNPWRLLVEQIEEATK